jgi:hypothetical protein
MLLVDPSGAVTTIVTGVWPAAPVTSTTRPVQPISVQALGPTTSHPEPKAATSTRLIAMTWRAIVTEGILACDGAPNLHHTYSSLLLGGVCDCAASVVTMIGALAPM